MDALSKSLKNLRSLRLGILISIGALLVLIPSLPMFYLWSPEATKVSEAGWNKVYLWRDPFTALLLTQFYVVFVAFLFGSKRTYILRGVLFIFSAFYFLYSGLLLLPSPDFIPGLSSYLLALALPLVISEYFVNKSFKKEELFQKGYW